MRFWKIAQGLPCTSPSVEGDVGNSGATAGGAEKGPSGISPEGLAPRSRFSTMLTGKAQSRVTSTAGEGAASKAEGRFRASLPGTVEPNLQRAETAKKAGWRNGSASSIFTRAGTVLAKPFDARAKVGAKLDLSRLDEAEVRWLVNSLKNVDVPEETRAHIEEHLGTFSGAALWKEANLFNHLMDSPNADRAVSTYGWMLSMSKDSPRVAKRLTAEIREELVRGVADPRTASIKGVKGVLGQRHVEEAARALIEMPKADYDRLTKALARAGLDARGNAAKAADAHTERALILKAVGARADRLKKSALDAEAKGSFMSFKAPSGRAVDEIIGFADKIRGEKREVLILKTTGLDIADGAQCENPYYGCGNYQRYANTCGPAAAQNVQAERDPIFGMKVREDFFRADNDSEITRQQKEVLETPRFYNENRESVTPTPEQMKAWLSDGTIPSGIHKVVKAEAVSLVGYHAEMLATPLLESNLQPETYQVVRKYMKNQRLTEAEEDLARNAIQEMSREIEFPNLTRKAHEGEMTLEMLIPEIRSNYVRSADGTSREKDGWSHFPEVLAAIAPAPRSREWRMRYTNDLKGGLSDQDIAGLDDALKRGSEIPISIGTYVAGAEGGSTFEDAHALMISDVRGEGAKRKYLVSDPASGKTEWVAQAEMKDYGSKWPEKYFDQPALGLVNVFFEE